MVRCPQSASMSATWPVLVDSASGATVVGRLGRVKSPRNFQPDSLFFLFFLKHRLQHRCVSMLTNGEVAQATSRNKPLACEKFGECFTPHPKSFPAARPCRVGPGLPVRASRHPTLASGIRKAGAGLLLPPCMPVRVCIGGSRLSSFPWEGPCEARVYEAL
jgi:hypothetical protein